MGFLSNIINGTPQGQQQAYQALATPLPTLQNYSANNLNLAPTAAAQSAYSGQAGFLPSVSNLTGQINQAQNQQGAASANAYAPGTTANIGQIGNTASQYLSGNMTPTQKAAMNEYAQGPGGFSSQTQTPQMNAFNFQNQLVQQGTNMNQQALNQTQQVNGPQMNIGSNFQNMNQIGNTANANIQLQNQIGQQNTGLANQQTMYNNQITNQNAQANSLNNFINQQAGKTSGGFLPGLEQSIGSQGAALGSSLPPTMLGNLMGGGGGGGGGGIMSMAGLAGF